MVGRDLIEAARVRSVVADFERFQTAIQVFRLKYNAIPGDIPNATNFWGTDASCPATPANTIPKRATCNGDGNGRVRGSVSCSCGELFRSWQQLANANLVQGQYTGVANTTSCSCAAVIGINVPTSQIPGSGYTFAANGNGPLLLTGNADHFDGVLMHSIVLGGQRVGYSAAPMMTPSAAYSIDTKLDDGKPGLGRLRSYKPLSTIVPGCTTNSDPNLAEYELTKTNNICSVLLRLGW
jgi:hypothetical protein